jgi:hypothetical protein
MTTARKLMLAVTAGLLGIALTGCSISFDENDKDKPGPSATSSTDGNGGTDGTNGTGGTNGNGGSNGNGGTNGNGGSNGGDDTSDPESFISTPRPLPTLKPGEKPTYTDTTVSSTLAVMIDNSSVLATSKGWYANINGKIVGTTSKATGNNASYVLAPFSLFPAGNAADLPSGFNSTNLIFVTTSAQHNVFASLLSILTPTGGTLTTFDAKQTPFSEALFASAAAAPSKTSTKPVTVKYGTSKSFGKYASTANAFSVVLNPGTAGAFSEVTLWVEKVGGKDVIVGVNDVRIGYGTHPSVETGTKEYAAAIDSSAAAKSPMALGRISRFWVDMTTWWLTR